MSTDLSQLYRQLADEADETPLPAPESLRRGADRRARIRMASTAAVVAVVAAGTVAGAQFVLGSRGVEPLPPAAPPATTPAQPTPTSPATATPSGTPSGAPSETRTAVPPKDVTPTSIPDRAFFTQPAGTFDGVEPKFVSEPPLPELCGAELPGTVVQRRGRTMVYKFTSTPAGHVPDGSLLQTITIHKADRAQAWLTALRAAVRDCAQQKINGVTYRQRLLTDRTFGDESVLFEVRYPRQDVEGNPTGGDEVRLIRAIRVGDVVTVLWERGWEGTSTDRDVLDDFSRRAVTAIRTWLE